MSAEKTFPGEAVIKITEKQDGSAQLSLRMDEETYDNCIEKVARDREMTVGQMIAEAIRLETIFIKARNDGNKIWFAKRNFLGTPNPRELISP